MSYCLKKTEHRNHRVLHYFFLFSIILLMGLCCIPPKTHAIDVDNDPKHDLYRITILDFLYVIGDEYPDIPNDADEMIEVINKMIARSQGVEDPPCIDLQKIKMHHGGLNEFFEAEMDGDINDCDYVLVYAFIDARSSNNWIALRMEYDGGNEEFEYEARNGISDNNATGDFTGHTVWMAFNNTAYYFREGDTVLVLSITGDPDFEDFLQSYIYYDFCPNSEIEEELITGSYIGAEPVTQFLDDFADFIFGWLFEGALPFLILIVLLLVLGQVLFDRKKPLFHWIGFGLLLFLLYPIIVYMLSINLAGVFGLPNIFSIIELIVLGSFLAFIVLSGFNAIGLLKHYKLAILLGFLGMITEQIVYICFYMTTMQIIALIILIFGSISLYVLLIFSKKVGRNKFK